MLGYTEIHWGTLCYDEDNYPVELRGTGVIRRLSRLVHRPQVKRFAEAFFTMDNPRSAATGCFDNAPQRYMAVTEAVRRSPYLQVSRVPLPVPAG